MHRDQRLGGPAGCLQEVHVLAVFVHCRRTLLHSGYQTKGIAAMTQTPELIYCLRGARACQTHRVSYRAWERYINAELAALTDNKDPVLNEAIITGIWGQDVASSAKASCNCGWGDWSVSERGNDADWLASCLCQD